MILNLLHFSEKAKRFLKMAWLDTKFPILITKNDYRTIRMLSNSYIGWTYIYKGLDLEIPEENDGEIYDGWEFYSHPVVAHISAADILSAINAFEEEGAHPGEIPHISDQPVSEMHSNHKLKQLPGLKTRLSKLFDQAKSMEEYLSKNKTQRFEEEHPNQYDIDDDIDDMWDDLG